MCVCYREVSKVQLVVPGSIINKNTIESFKDCDKIHLINEKGRELAETLKTQAVDEPYLINKFFIISFSDLKKYHYYYWFCFPAVSHNISLIKDVQRIEQVFDEDQTNVLTEGYLKLDSIQKTFFAFVRNNDNYLVKTLKDVLAEGNVENEIFWCFSDPASDQDYPGWPLRNYLEFLSYHL